VKLYVDGVLVASNISYWTFSNSSWPVVLGAAGVPPGTIYGNPLYFSGRLDEATIWNYPRTQAQIQSDMAAPLTGTETGVIMHYNFDAQGCGQTLYDRSVSGYDAPFGESPSEDTHDPNWVADGPF
jgi:hypothetical protein